MLYSKRFKSKQDHLDKEDSTKLLSPFRSFIELMVERFINSNINSISSKKLNSHLNNYLFIVRIKNSKSTKAREGLGKPRHSNLFHLMDGSRE